MALLSDSMCSLKAHPFVPSPFVPVGAECALIFLGLLPTLILRNSMSVLLKYSASFKAVIQKRVFF